MSGSVVRPVEAGDREWIRRLMRERWGGETVVSRGTVHRPADLPGFVALRDGERVGLVTCHVVGRQCEVVTLDSLMPGVGVGTTLIAAARDWARGQGCRRLWLITTNDNVEALRFYQKRGFVLAALHRNAVAASRHLKPSIPMTGTHGIPIRDEIELEIVLDEGGRAMDQTDVRVEQADPADAAQILALQKLAYQSEAALYNDYAIPPLTQTLEQMQADLRGQVVLKAVRDGAIVGSVRAFLCDGTCHVGRLIVHPECQGRGIGTSLMAAIEGRFPGARRFELFTGESSERNIRLYSKLGYRAFRTERLSDRTTVVYMEKVAGRAT